MADVYRQTEIGRPGMGSQPNVHLHTDPSVGAPHAGLEATEMAAFEKGRMQGEMEAMRRMEAEQAQLKQFPAEAAAPVILAQPDVVEINRMTWPQRLATVLGELTGIAYLIMLIGWFKEYRGGFGWSNHDGGDARGDIQMWNTSLFVAALGLFCNSQALLMYRILPLRTPAFMNRLIYTFWQCAAIALYSMAIAGWVMSTPETTWWGAEKWCYALGFTVYGLHALYSMARTWLEPIRAVHVDTWNETPNTVRDTLLSSPEQHRDQSLHNQAGRTLYAAQPHTLTRLANKAAHGAEHVAHPTHAHTGIAPRWSEFPHSHAEDYFLLPRAKWAVTGFFGMAAPILMTLAVVQHVLATGRDTWSQYEAVRQEGPLTENTREARLISATGLILLASVLFVAYAAMPPRTTLVKNGGVIADGNANRRSSISHNAETRIGGQNIV